MPDQPDLIATDLLRLARDPATGRIRHRSTLEIGLRAALFAELALTGQITDRVNSPVVIGEEPTGNRLLDAICRTVKERPDVTWRRWFRHVRVDRTALSADLVEAGRWTRRPGTRLVYTDSEPEQAQALAYELNRVATFDRAPVDSREAVLAVLAVACGAIGRRPRPAATRRDLKPVLDAINHHTTQKIVVTASTVMRKARRASAMGR